MKIKNLIIFSLLVTMFVNANSQGFKIGIAEMGTDYKNDVYFSLSDENAILVDRSNWDIAFNSGMFSVSILANGGAGVELYYISNDTNDWNSLDTSGLSQMPYYANSTDSWEVGAFNFTTSGGNYSYGWGSYNPATHFIEGDVIYVIKLRDASYKEIFITKKNAPANTYIFKYADIDGTNEKYVVLKMNDYVDKNFVGYSLIDGTIVDREPNSDSWDLLFSKYVEMINMGTYEVPYPVMGVLSNNDVYIAEVEGVDQENYENYDGEVFDSNSISVIGRDWKVNVGTTFPIYEPKTDLVYFISDINGDVFKLYFTDFITGSGDDGITKFNYKELINTSITESSNKEIVATTVYPNPGTAENTKLLVRADQVYADASVQVFDLNGKVLFETKTSFVKGLNVFNLNSSNLTKGQYVVKVNFDQNISSTNNLIIAK